MARLGELIINRRERSREGGRQEGGRKRKMKGWLDEREDAS